MQDYEKWGIMADWRYSYMTMMPDYEGYVLEQFANLLQKKGTRKDKDLIFRGNRAVFWSIDSQRIMDEHQIQEHKELRDCVVAKFPILSYSDNGSKVNASLAKISEMYDNVQVLVFCDEPWKVMGV